MTRTTILHRVPFYETDAMGIVHHANYVRYLELVRIAWMDEHDRPYREYVRDGLHFSTTRVDLRYVRSSGFDDVLHVMTWLEWVAGASLGMGYEIDRDGVRVAEGLTEHAMVDTSGRPRRIPAEHRERFRGLARASGGSRTRRGTVDRSR
ncbi:MAG: acyl-CoA thioesterase [Deltaproteobacteria bacterium]|nr:acyl-CoA thioesterase [Deltaproteobacteria bacterium]